MVELREVLEENFEECLALKVREEQRPFVAPNQYSIAQAYIFRDMVKLFAIYAGNEMVGFTMLNLKDPWICRFMIDRRSQKSGYGKQAVRLILSFFAGQGVKSVKLSVEPENTAAKKLYGGCGFAETGEIDDGEIVMKAEL